ncbi:Potassium uptake protein, integral membrane component,KtrB, partial [Vibrio parahaemolyticus]
MTQFHQIFFF